MGPGSGDGVTAFSAYPVTEGRRTGGLPATRPWILAGVAVVASQTYFLLTGGSSFWWGGLVALFLLQGGLFGLFWVFTRWDGLPLSEYGFFQPRPLWPALVLAILLGGVYEALSLEPGVTYGFQTAGFASPLIFGAAVFLAPLMALGQESVFRGYVLGRLLAPGRFSVALYFSAAVFALASTNLPVLLTLSPTPAAELVITGTVPAFALGIVLGVYFYKSGRGLLGPWVLRTGLLLWASLFPLTIYTAPWDVVFVSQLLGYGAILLFLAVSLREPKILARKYLGERFGPRRDRFLEHMRRSRRVRGTIVTVVAVAVIAIVAVAVVEVGLDTTHPFLAIESDSMTPTFARGDLVVIQHVPASQIGVGTIIAYTSTCLPSPVVHRVVAVQSGSNGPVYTTKGDHNPTADVCPVPFSTVLGRVVLILPAIGFFVLYPELTVALLILVVVLSIVLGPGMPTRFPRGRTTT